MTERKNPEEILRSLVDETEDVLKHLAKFMSHTAELPNYPDGLGAADLLNWAQRAQLSMQRISHLAEGVRTQVIGFAMVNGVGQKTVASTASVLSEWLKTDCGNPNCPVHGRRNNDDDKPKN